MKLMTQLMVPLAAATMMSGCAWMGLSSSNTSGAQVEGSTPPRLVRAGNKDAQGREMSTWENVRSFAKVSGSLKATGDDICSRGRSDLEAVGYHSKAQGLDGNSIPGGGFLCAPRQR